MNIVYSECHNHLYKKLIHFSLKAEYVAKLLRNLSAMYTDIANLNRWSLNNLIKRIKTMNNKYLKQQQVRY